MCSISSVWLGFKPINCGSWSDHFQLLVISDLVSIFYSNDTCNRNRYVYYCAHGSHFHLLGKGGYVFGSVGLSVCLCTTLLKQLWTDWDEILWRGPMKNWLNFGGDLVAYPDRGAGNDPFFFFFFFWGGGGGGGVGSLSPPRLNIFTVGNMRVMICLGQEGLCSLSASSYEIGDL